MSSDTAYSEFVADTIALVLRLEGRRMGNAAKAAFDAAESGTATIHVPSMALAEIMYLSEKGRITASLHDVSDYLNRYPCCKECPMSLAIIQAASQISDVPELHDRLIAGTARWL